MKIINRGMKWNDFLAGQLMFLAFVAFVAVRIGMGGDNVASGLVFRQ